MGGVDGECADFETKLSDGVLLVMMVTLKNGDSCFGKWTI